MQHPDALTVARSCCQWPSVKRVPRNVRAPAGTIAQKVASPMLYSTRVVSLSVKNALAPVTVPSSGVP